MVRALLNRHAARHFAHRREERQAPVGSGDGLVGDRGDSAGQQPFGQVGERRQVEIGVEDLPLAKQLHFLGLNLLDLDQEIAGFEDLIAGLHDPRSRRGELAVRDQAAVAGSGLDQHLVPGGDQGVDAPGDQPDPVLAVLDLPDRADPHAAFSALGAFFSAFGSGLLRLRTVPSKVAPAWTTTVAARMPPVRTPEAPISAFSTASTSPVTRP